MALTFSNRRVFLGHAAGGLCAPFLSRLSFGASELDLRFGSAVDVARALRTGYISCRELLATVFGHIDTDNPRINAFVTLNREAAEARAAKADEMLASGKTWGPLHGVPILIKDSFETEGLRTTSGSSSLANYIPGRDAIAVSRLIAAGAIIVGKTNLPEFASDLQSHNELVGTTNNPWDLKRTPGGSTGGGAAALAAGFGFLELGSDIGGSIRTPAHFCGVYGHKPTLDLVPELGHIPPPPGQISVPNNLSVAGPLARSAQDLLLELSVIAGPLPEQRGCRLGELLPSRGTRLQDYRLGFVVSDSFCPVSSEVRGVMEEVMEALRKSGVRIVEGWPPGFDPEKAFECYLQLLGAAFAEAIGVEEREVIRKAGDEPWAKDAKTWLSGVEMLHSEWKGRTAEQLRYRAVWQEYFNDFDGFLMPENLTPAFEHTPGGNFFARTIQTLEGTRQYGEMLRWISPATLTGCPATVAPAGRTSGGLPVGVQVLGPMLGDAITIQIAGALSGVIGGFVPPPLLRP